jgi:uncharacterized protein YkwD
MSASSAAENVAYNQGYADPPYQAFYGWVNSPPHNSAMLNATYNCTGIGAARAVNGAWYFTQIFVRTP